jgi:hypothetical protein
MRVGWVHSIALTIAFEELRQDQYNVLSRPARGVIASEPKDINLATLAPENPGILRRVLPQVRLGERARKVVRGAMFVYSTLVLCPIAFQTIENNVDNTWVFALSCARAHQLVIGRDVFWGLLSYLVFPMNLGPFFALAIAFQAAVWIFLILLLWDLIYRRRLPLRNLVVFSILLGLSGTVSGVDEVLWRCALILLIQHQLSASLPRYFAALAIFGFLPLFKSTWMVACPGAVLGLIAYLLLTRRTSAWRDIALAAAVPAFVVTIGFWLTLESFHTWTSFMTATSELSSGFNLAMSTSGAPTEVLAAFEALVLLAIALGAVAVHDRKLFWFFSFTLAVPLFISFKHGFVRQDAHIHHYFCFIALALSLAALSTPLDKQRTFLTFAAITLIMALVWQDNVARTGPRFALASTGLDAPLTLWNLMRHGGEQRPFQAAPEVLPRGEGLEPEISAIVGHEPIAALSEIYTDLYTSGFDLRIYPIIQRHSAYTPYLDALNASWIRNRGPRFLIFDGKATDGRHPWVETPAMWLEVYRWYNTRFLGPRHLLLERRTQPRFTHLEPIVQSEQRLGDALTFPASPHLLFWSMSCSLSSAGRLRATLFRVPEVTITVDRKNRSDSFRVPLAVTVAPSPATGLPGNLEEFATVFRDGENHSSEVQKIRFGGPGASAYAPACKVEFLRPSND